MSHQWEHICLEARKVIAETVIFIRQQAKNFDHSVVEHKGFNDLVSYVDKTAEEMLVNGLRPLIPGCGFITEENTAGARGEQYRWVIDPLDGTTNFVHGVPCYCVSVALLDGEELIMGIIHEVNLDECFYSWKGAKAFKNNIEIQVSDRKLLADSLIVTGFPYTNFSRLDDYMKIFDYCMRNTHGIRRPGSAAVDLAYVACGRFEAFYEYGLNAWDIAAGAFIVQQAGGKVSNFSGNSNFVFGKEIIATNSNVYQEFLDVVKSKMNS
ncbi:MAG: inositol monophosphatase [Bacteroidetes bacterium]|nr:inositol monophosphatase [Bacteroidota bacterium]